MALKNLILSVIVILVFLVFAFYFIGYNLKSSIDLFNKSKSEYHNITNMSWPWIFCFHPNRKRSSSTVSTLVGLILVAVAILIIVYLSAYLGSVAKRGNSFIANNLSNYTLLP